MDPGFLKLGTSCSCTLTNVHLLLHKVGIVGYGSDSNQALQQPLKLRLNFNESAGVFLPRAGNTLTRRSSLTVGGTVYNLEGAVIKRSFTDGDHIRYTDNTYQGPQNALRKDGDHQFKSFGAKGDG